jgi:N-succinyldiaminopimelate aminotransferase
MSPSPASAAAAPAFIGNPVFNLPTTIFEVMSRLAEEHKAVNLGQGFPDDRGPADVLAEAERALREDSNQYPSMMGTPALRQALAGHAKRFYDLDLDWRSQTLVTSGATEALAACLLGLLSPGDEVVLFEPLYDSYLPIIRLAGAVPKFVRLQPPHWGFTTRDLENAFSDKTKLVLINDPLNPAGKAYTVEELDLLASFIIRHDALAVCDEVYEHLTFDGRGHTPLLTRPGMAERCLKIGSAGKTFSLTGWKVGYVTGPARLIAPTAKAHQFLTFTTPPNLQAAVAFGLNKDDGYFTGLAADMQRRRDKLSAGLNAAGLKTLDAGGSYFVIADISPFMAEPDDAAFCRRMTQEVGVAAVPVSAFYAGNAPRHLIRFCFCKSDKVLDTAMERLSRLPPSF